MKTTKTRNYKLTTRHPHWPQGNGTFDCRVTDTPDGKRYVVCDPFGCSRDYDTASDEGAVKKLLAEHATEFVSMK